MSISSDLSLQNYEQEPGRFELDNPSFVQGDEDDRRNSEEVSEQGYKENGLSQSTRRTHGNGSSSSSCSSSSDEEDDESDSEYLTVGDYREFSGHSAEASSGFTPQ